MQHMCRWDGVAEIWLNVVPFPSLVSALEACDIKSEIQRCSAALRWIGCSPRAVLSSYASAAPAPEAGASTKSLLPHKSPSTCATKHNLSCRNSIRHKALPVPPEAPEGLSQVRGHIPRVSLEHLRWAGEVAVGRRHRHWHRLLSSCPNSLTFLLQLTASRYFTFVSGWTLMKPYSYFFFPLLS